MSLTENEKRRVFEEEKLRQAMQGKSVFLSVFLSFILPGLGDLYCGSYIKALIFFSLGLLGFIMMFAMGLGVFILTPTWFIGLISAWMSANKSGRRNLRRAEKTIAAHA